MRHENLRQCRTHYFGFLMFPPRRLALSSSEVNLLRAVVADRWELADWPCSERRHVRRPFSISPGFFRARASRPGERRGPATSAKNGWSPRLFLDLARSMERACFDYILIEDSIYVGQNWKNSREIFLKNGMSVPRQEPSRRRDADGGGDDAARHRADAVDLRLPSVSGGAHPRHA